MLMVSLFMETISLSNVNILCYMILKFIQPGRVVKYSANNNVCCLLHYLWKQVTVLILWVNYAKSLRCERFLHKCCYPVIPLIFWLKILDMRVQNRLLSINLVKIFQKEAKISMKTTEVPNLKCVLRKVSSIRWNHSHRELYL